MPRPRRIVPANYVFHVLNRGCDRRAIFTHPKHYANFVSLMATAAGRCGVRILAYCLMPNHWHLLLWPTSDGAITAFIHWLCTCHVSQMARERGAGAGHLYQGRFRCFVVETADYYYRAAVYVEDNARRAGLAARAEDWRWSSASERAPGAERWLVVPGPLALPDDCLTIVNRGASADDLDRLRGCSVTDRPYGSHGWATLTADRLGLGQRLRPCGRPARSCEVMLDQFPPCGPVDAVLQSAP